jgi:hypothetical protein
MAVSNVVSSLRERGALVDVATCHKFEWHGAEPVNWWTINPLRYRCVVFICGPVSDEWYFRLLFYKFGLARRVAVGVSIIDANRSDARRFDEIVARDGLSESHFDLSLAGDLTPSSIEKSTIVICLRGHQNEYGADACCSARVDDLLWRVAERQGLTVTGVSTVVDPVTNTIEDINRHFAHAKLVLTTRLHGSLIALRHGVPFVAVDQIKGGGKVSAVLGKLGWEYLYSANVKEAEIDSACKYILNHDGIAEDVSNAAVRAQQLSRAALRRSLEVIMRE